MIPSKSKFTKIFTADSQKYIDKFIDSLSGSSATKGTYKRALKGFTKWLNSTKGFGFRQYDVERYKKYLVEERGLSMVSISTYLTSIRRLFNYFKNNGWIDENPASKVKGGPRPSDHSKAYFNSKDAMHLLASIDTSTPIGLRDFAMINLMLRCGLREIELQRCDVGDLQVKTGQIVLYVQGKGETIKNHFVVLTDKAHKAVTDYLASRGPIKDEDPLFGGIGNRSKGNRMTTRAIREAITRCIKASGLHYKNISPNSLRHTAALLALEGGAPVSAVKNMMRHGDINTTMIYVRERERIENAAENYIDI